MNQRRKLVVAGLLLGSGFCALVYQVIWLRSLRLVFGASTPATATVLAIFMGGLGFGSLWWSRKRAHDKNPLLTYAKLEAFVALSTALSPFLIDGVRSLYLNLGGSEGLGSMATLLRVLGSILVLGFPVFAMGGTLPIVSQIATAHDDKGRKGLALVYGLNTVGGVLGALAANFVLIEVLGIRSSLWLVCTLNLMLALLANGLSRDATLLPDMADDVKPDVVEPDEPSELACANDEEPSAERLPRPLLLGAAFVTGFVFLFAELLWFRMGAPILSGSTYSFGLILAVALSGIGLGGLVYAFAPLGVRTPTVFALSCTLEGVLLLLPYALGDDLAFLAHDLRTMHTGSFAWMLTGWTLICIVMVFPVSLVAGFQFPLLLALRGEGTESVSTDVGEMLTANTLGAILGSLLGGFILLPKLGALLSWQGCAWLLLFMGVAAVLVDEDRWRHKSLLGVQVALLFVLVAFSGARGPTAFWRHGGIGAGRSNIAGNTPVQRWTARNMDNFLTFKEREGKEAALGFQRSTGYSLQNNGKSDGDSLTDASTTLGLGLFGAALHPHPKTAFVVGLGAGQTAGYLAEIGTMKKVEVVELEEDVVEFAELCSDVNANVLHHPLIQLSIADAREALITSPRKYDLIVSEPSNPYRAGIADFFSVDFFNDAREHLHDDGIFLQWVQSYGITPEVLGTVVTTLKSAFPHVSIWAVGGADYVFMATEKPQVIDVEALRTRMQKPPFKLFFNRITYVDSVEDFLAHHLASDDFSSLVQKKYPLHVHTNDAPLLDFMFSRWVGSGLQLPSIDIFRAARMVKAQRPPVVGEVDWRQVGFARHRMAAYATHSLFEGSAADSVLQGPDRAHLTALGQRNFRTSLLTLNALPQTRAGSIHDLWRTVFWTYSASALDVDKLELRWQRLRKDFPTEVKIMEAEFAIQQFYDDAHVYFAKAVQAAEKDPWAFEHFDRLLRLFDSYDLAHSEKFIALLEDHELAGGALTVRRLFTSLRLRIYTRNLKGCTKLMQRIGPDWPLGVKNTLLFRAYCYQKEGHVMAEKSAEDLAFFTENQPQRLNAFLQMQSQQIRSRPKKSPPSFTKSNAKLTAEPNAMLNDKAPTQADLDVVKEQNPLENRRKTAP